MVPSAAGGLAGGALLARRRPRGPFVRNPCDNSRSGAILTPEGASRTESRLKPTSRRRFLARESFRRRTPANPFGVMRLPTAGTA